MISAPMVRRPPVDFDNSALMRDTREWETESKLYLRVSKTRPYEEVQDQRAGGRDKGQVAVRPRTEP